jgi:hypothetical protein
MQVKPQYEQLDEYRELAKKLINHYPDRFYHIDLDQVRAYSITNKDRSQTNPKLFEMGAVKMPVLKDCTFSHYIVVHQSDWDILDRKHKLLLIAQTLLAIPADENGEMLQEKVNTFDMKDFSPMLRTFGPDYLVKDNVPDLLYDTVSWVD